MTLRVLHLNSGNLFGGVETYLATLAECRDLAPSMKPEFGLCFPGRHEAELRNSGCPVHLLGAVRFSRPWTVWSARRKLKRVLTANAIDVVVCHQPWIQALFGPVVTRCRKAYVAYYHGVAGRGWQERKAFATQPDLVVAPSRFTLDTLGEAFPKVPRAVVHNPLPTRLRTVKAITAAERNAKRQAFGVRPEDVVIIMVSRVEAMKGPDLVIEALTALRDEPRWRFWYAGQPQRPHERELFAKLQTMATAAGIDARVQFLGSRNDVPELLQLADISTQANREPEGFGLSYLEAAYTRLPIVTTAPGALGEMVDATNGLIVPPNDAPALTDAYRLLIRDAALRAMLGAGGRAKAERQCDTATQLNRMAELFATARQASIGLL